MSTLQQRDIVVRGMGVAAAVGALIYLFKRKGAKQTPVTKQEATNETEISVATYGYAILADVGGTNARLELSKVNRGVFKSEVIKSTVYTTNNYDGGLDQVLNEFLEEFRGTEQYPSIGVIAVAAPVVNNITEKFANSTWPPIDGDATAKKFGLSSLTLLNDFVAVGHALDFVTESDLATINKGKPTPTGIKTAVGPGTGLGVCFVSHHKTEKNQVIPQVNPVEAAHSVFSSQDDEEVEFGKFFLKKNPQWTYFHTEHGFSGPSVPVMYEFFAQKENKKEPCTLKGKEIFELARKGEDPIARKTLDFFLKLYGEFISNWAINLMPQGGIYLTGGMTAGVHDEISREDGPFMKAYYNKEFLNSKLELFPIHVVKVIELGLLGCYALSYKKAVSEGVELLFNDSAPIISALHVFLRIGTTY